MATYFVSSSGSNTSPYDTWAKAATSLATALAAASTAGDIVVIQYNGIPSGDATLAGATVYTFANHVALISASNDGGSAWTPTVMGTSTWIGNSSSSRSITFQGAYRCYIYGLTLRTSATGTASIFLSNSDGAHHEYDSCYFWQGNTSATAQYISFGGAADQQSYTRLKNCTFRFGTTGQYLLIGSRTWMLDCKMPASDGSAPATLFAAWGGFTDPASVGLWAESCDFSRITDTLCGSSSRISTSAIFSRCKLGSGVTIMAAQTPANLSSLEVSVLDCSSGDTHGLFQYHNALGSVVSDTGIYYTSGAAGQSWKITTTADCSYYTPFRTPFVDLYNTGTTAVTPYFEILRDGSSTAYQNDEVWAEFVIKETSGSVQGTPSGDGMALGGSAADQASGAGTSSWTGENATAWSGKVDSGSARTPAENGHIRGRVAVGEPSITVYVDPQIRT